MSKATYPLKLPTSIKTTASGARAAAFWLRDDSFAGIAVQLARSQECGQAVVQVAVAYQATSGTHPRIASR